MGTGSGYLFKNGTRTEIFYEFKDGEISLSDSTGNPVRLARGKTWVSIVDYSTPIRSNEKR